MKIYLSILLVFIAVQIGNSQEFTRQDPNFNIIGSFGTGTPFGGGAVSFADFNDDGLDDLTFGTFTGTDIKFYENTGDGFDLINPPFISNLYDHRQIIWVDYDNDGDKDIYVTALDGPNLLYENDGNMNFTDVSSTRGLSSQNVLTEGANFADIDRDGFLELYVCNYDNDGITLNGHENEMYKWQPQLNAYQDITLTSGTGNGARTSFCTAFFDMDMDNDLDMYVINDYPTFQNSLYMNIGGGQFIDVSVPSLTNIAIEAMNAGISDFDQDGDFDIYITDVTQAVLFQNNGNNTFTDVAVAAGVTANAWSWTGNFFDYDNDRDDDLYVCSQINTEPNFFYVNNNDGTFSEPLANSGGITGQDELEAITNAIGDINNDGKLDIIINSRNNNNFRLYVNNDLSNNNFIKLNLKGVFSNKAAYGALVEVWIDGVKSIQHKHCGVALKCQNSDYLHFGIGQATAVDSIVVKWPFANSEDVIYTNDILVNGMNVIEEGSGSIDAYTLEICTDSHTILIDPIPSQNYGATQDLFSNTGIHNGNVVLFQSETSITLDVGFEINLGAEFEAEIEVCGN